MSSKDPEVVAMYIALHPMRHRILRLLEGKGKLYIKQIARRLGTDEKLVAFHLSTLRQHGLVEGEFALQTSESKVGRPILVKHYWLTEKARSILSLIPRS